MSEVTNEVVAKETAKKAVKKVVKKVVKKATKKAAKKTVKKTIKKTVKIDRHMADMPVSERRAKFLALLKKLRAIDGPSAVSGKVLAEKLGFTEYDVYVLGYKTSPLIIENLVRTAKLANGQRGLSYYLTKKSIDKS